MRGTVARAEIRRVLAATYHQVWWPDTSTVKYDGDELPVWDEHTGNYLDPATGEVLPDWDQALDELGDQPHHVARFGVRFDAQGVLAGSKDAARCIGYLTKYLTKQVGDCHHADTDAAAGPCGPAGRGAAVPAVLAAVRELAAVRHPAQERPARPGPRPVQGQSPRRRSPRLRRAPGAGLPQVVRQDPGRPPGRPQGMAPVHARCSGNRPGPVRLGSSSRPATRTTWSMRGGCCMPSPTALDGKPRSLRRDVEPTDRTGFFRQMGERRDGQRWA